MTVSKTDATTAKNARVTPTKDEVEPSVSNSAAPAEDPSESPEDIHWVQRFMDNPWILLALGILIPALSYTTWGWIELFLIKPAQLP